MIKAQVTLGICGMLGSTAAMGTEKALESLWLQGGAVACFIGFLLWVIRILMNEVKLRDKKNDDLQEEVRSVLRESIDKSNQTNEDLVQELKQAREERSK